MSEWNGSTRNRISLPIAALAVALVTVSVAQGADPAVICQASKLLESGKYGKCRLTAEARGVRTGATPDFVRCEAKFLDKWGKIEARTDPGMCPSEGDATNIGGRITEHADNVAFLLSGGTTSTTLTTTTSTTTSTLPSSVCGNEIVESPEQCDGSDFDGASCQSIGDGSLIGDLSCTAGCAYDASDCHAYKRVFVTSTVHNGNLGGLSGADAICEGLADAEGLGGSWTAWLSDSVTDARDRITDSEYRLVGANIVAFSLADLTDGQLEHTISLDESNSLLLSGTAEVWTGTESSGLGSGVFCQDWTNGLPGGFIIAGRLDRKNSTWTNADDIFSCDDLKRLYCFED